MPGTTNLLIEILSIGSIASIWLYLLLAKIYNFDHILTSINTFNNFKVLMIAIGVLLIYQLGWFINWISRIIFNSFLEPYRQELFACSNPSYQDARALIYQYSSVSTLKELENEITEMRLCRANAINFLMITVFLIYYDGVGTQFLIISFIAFVGLTAQAIITDLHHYKKLYELYSVLEKQGLITNLEKLRLTPGLG